MANNLKLVDQVGLLVDRYEPAFPMSFCGKDIILPHYYLIIIHQGSARLLYDMHEKILGPNMIVLAMRGHIIRFEERSDDLVFSRLIITPEIFNEMLSGAFSHDIRKFHVNPGYVLTDEQMVRLMKVLELLEIIAMHDEQDYPYRHQMLLTQLTVGYEFLNYYRREQDKKITDLAKSQLLNRFCDLVVTHFRESREVQFYAEKMDLHPYYFTRVIREASGGISPAQWIEQYVITRAKKMIETQPDQSIVHIAFELGFAEPTSFYRYFKHSTGMTAKEYRAAHCLATIKN